MDARCRRLVALVILLLAGLLVQPPAVRAEAVWTPAASPAENHGGQLRPSCLRAASSSPD